MGQNFFRSAADAERFVAQLEDVPPDVTIVEVGPGSGQITTALSRLGHRVLAVEIDDHWSKHLAGRALTGVTVVTADFLRWRPPEGRCSVVGNVPFGAGTQILRHCLELGPRRLLGAVLLLQSEYVDKRVGRWGGNLFNAQWWPWYEFAPGIGFPRQAFRPVPRTDTATLLVRALVPPALPWNERVHYQELVRHLYETGHATLADASRAAWGSAGGGLVRSAGLTGSSAVKHLDRDDWVALFEASRQGPTGRGRRAATDSRRGPATRSGRAGRP